MSSTAVATSPSSPSQDARFPRSLLTKLRSLASSRSAATGSAVGPGAPEPPPPPKRRRIDSSRSSSPTQRWQQHDVFVNCLKDQVFPHVDRAVAHLPQDRVNTKEIGKLTVRFLTDKDTVFADEYKRGNGTVSPEFERQLALRAFTHSQTLAQLPEYQLGPRQPETPVPIPNHGAYPSLRTEAVFKKPYTPRHSTSPIPPPVIPSRSPTGRTPLRSSAAAGLASSPIVIDDDSDEEVQPRTNTPAKAPPQNESKEEPRREPRQEPTPKSDALPEAQKPVDSEPNVRSLVVRPTLLTQPQTQTGTPAGGIVSSSLYFTCEHHPYVPAQERALVLGAAHRPLKLTDTDPSLPVVYHVDFTIEEIRVLRKVTREVLQLTAKKKKDVKRDLTSLLKKNRAFHQKILDLVEQQAILPRRKRADIANLFRDLTRHRTAQEPLILSLGKDDHDAAGFARASRVDSLLFRREVSGQRGFRSMRRLVNFNNEFRICREDDLALRAEWTDCAGDIITIVWVSNDAFICGTTEHSDSHNQQYNRPGNLVLGSCSMGTVRAYPDHRIVRPVIEKGENSTDAMRQSQDPWLYSSVVSSDYDATHRRAFTSGFDRTVKIWKVSSGASMRAIGEWKHGGNVNFVAASKHESGMVATASDVAADAVRIYSVNENDLTGSPFRSYSCSRVTDAEGNTVSTEKWAYFPATMQWGVAEGVKHLLLVGYSPRSRTGDDSDIPEDRIRSGELCLWDGLSGERWKLTSATTQNVFEVLWHPTQHCFIAATSPLGLDVEDRVRTQIRIFRVSDHQEYGGKAFTPVKTLDCFAADINELTIMPNSFTYCYVTAGCTDGNTYVWDTSQGDKPIHILRHGDCIEELRGDREREDVGVKFTAWGTTADRFYTGSSDGVVKVWNVRSLERPLVRTLLEVPAQVSCGMFSPDRTKLLIGDASGRIFLLSLDEEGTKPATYKTVTLPGNLGVRRVREPIPIIQHKEPPPPAFDAEGQPYMAETGPSRGKAYLEAGFLERHPNPTIGVVRGPRYAETGLFRAEAHLDGDPTQPLLANWEARQQEAIKMFPRRNREQFTPLRPVRDSEELLARHGQNSARDLDINTLSLDTRHELEAAGADLELVEDYDFDYDVLSNDEFF